MSVNVSQKHANFIERSVRAAQQLAQIYTQIVGLRSEWDSLGYSSAIVDSDFSVPSGTGQAYPYLAASDLASFYTSEGNLVTYWTSGNGTNIDKLIP
jgi:hypothetical protein